LNRIKEKDWRGARSDAALEEFVLFSNMVATYLLTPLGILVTNYMDVNNENFNEETSTGIDRMLRDISEEKIKDILQQLPKTEWKHLLLDVILIRGEIQEVINIYQPIMPKNLLSELLILRVKFKAIDTNVGLFNSIFLYSETDWAERTGQRRNLYNDFCRDISKCIYEYLSSVSKFRSLLSEKSA
jgi:hypothetical protein